ncbi:MAG TPA: hypothetical protein VGM53_05605 [Streptosporangiaceae bacterium]
MRTSRALTVLAAAGLLAATATGATSRAAASTHTQACTPKWKLVATPASLGANAQMTGAAVVSGKDVWFPGSTFTPGVAAEQPWVLHWNGHSLKPAATVPQGPFTTRDTSAGSFDSATDGWVLGRSTILPVAYPQYAARWHGGRWTITPLAVSPNPTSNGNIALNAVASLAPGNAWAVGSFSTLVPLGAMIEHWDGTQWNVVPNPASSQTGAELNAITVVSASDIWAVGQQENAASVTVPFAEHWDGTAWSVVPVPAGNSPSHFLAVSADSAGDVWAVGAQTEPGTSDTGVNLVEHWDGTAWSVVTGLPDLGNSELQQVYAASPTDVWATVYAPRTDTDLGVDNFLHFNGTSWTTVPAPGPHEYGLNYEYAGIDGTGPGNIWAAGYSFPAPDGSDTPVIAHLSCG